jgi:hypothetical protein
MSLTDLFINNKFNTDKYNLGYIENFYDDFLKTFLNKEINFLEIGIAKCGSIKMWRKYFHVNSKIFAGDIQKHSECPNDIEYIIENCYLEKTVQLFEDNFFDIIIDDGPHTFTSFKFLITKYFSKLKNDGYLIIEDVLRKEWIDPLLMLSKEIGYKKCEVIDMTGKQKTKLLLDKWKDGLFILKIQK